MVGLLSQFARVSVIQQELCVFVEKVQSILIVPWLSIVGLRKSKEVQTTHFDSIFYSLQVCKMMIHFAIFCIFPVQVLYFN